MSMTGKIIASVKVDFKQSLIYVSNFILTYLSDILAMMIQLVFWRAVYVAGTDQQFSNLNVYTTKIGGYRLSEMIAYILISFLMSSCNASVGINNQIKNDIMNGGLNGHLIRPIQYLLYRWCATISKQILTIVLSIVMGFIFIMMLDLNIRIDKSIMIVTITFLFFALGISFLFSLIIGLLSFWMYETSSVSVIFGAIVQFLAGGLLPLDFFGEGVTAVVHYLPFTYMSYFPVQIMLGRVNTFEILRGGIICCFWICLMSIIVLSMWRKGIRRYSAIGG